MNGRTKNIVLCGLMAAITGVCSQLIIPLPMVPINLALLAVLLSGSLLGTKYGSIAMCVYVMMAAVGVPVMAGFTGGFGALLGKTGGYVIGYIFCAMITGALSNRWGTGFWPLCLAMGVGVVVNYAFGTAWFMVVTRVDVLTTLMYCVVPFIIGDVLKVGVACLITRKLKHRIPR